MPFAARIGDLHTFSLLTGSGPHGGAPIIGLRATTMLIGGQPGACLGDPCVCVSAPDLIVQGSTSVLICGKPAARHVDSTAHGGAIPFAMPTVLIGG